MQVLQIRIVMDSPNLKIDVESLAGVDSTEHEKMVAEAITSII